jgi:hypothetical protein
VMFLNDGKHMSITSHYFGKSAIVFSVNVNGKSYSDTVHYIAVHSAGCGFALFIYSLHFRPCDKYPLSVNMNKNRVSG